MQLFMARRRQDLSSQLWDRLGISFYQVRGNSMQVSTSISTGVKSGGDTQGHTKQQAVFPAGHMVLFSLVTVLFFLWGMSNNLTDILVQQFKKSFELST